MGKRWTRPNKAWIALCFVVGPITVLVLNTAGISLGRIVGTVAGFIPSIICYKKWPESGKKMPKGYLVAGPAMAFITLVALGMIANIRYFASN